MKANPGVQCGNPLHPDGPWHTASPIPPTWERRERLRQWWRKRRYGCGCAVVADVTALLDAYDSVTAALAAAEQRADTLAATIREERERIANEIESRASAVASEPATPSGLAWIDGMTDAAALIRSGGTR